MKNSWGANWGDNGYLHYFVHPDHGHLSPYAYITGVEREVRTTANGPLVPYTQVRCVDEDGDGYYNWGLGPRPANLPAGAYLEPDGDDTDPSVGPLGSTGYMRSNFCFQRTDKTGLDKKEIAWEMNRAHPFQMAARRCTLDVIIPPGAALNSVVSSHPSIVRCLLIGGGKKVVLYYEGTGEAYDGIKLTATATWRGNTHTFSRELEMIGVV